MPIGLRTLLLRHCIATPRVRSSHNIHLASFRGTALGYPLPPLCRSTMSEAAAPAPAAPAPAPNGNPKPAKAGKKGGKDDSLAGQMAALELNPPPGYIQHRVDMFERLLKEYNDFVTAQPREAIEVTLPDDSVKPATSWETAPIDIAKSLSAFPLSARFSFASICVLTCRCCFSAGKSLSDKIVIAKVRFVLTSLCSASTF